MRKLVALEWIRRRADNAVQCWVRPPSHGGLVMAPDGHDDTRHDIMCDSMHHNPTFNS